MVKINKTILGVILIYVLGLAVSCGLTFFLGKNVAYEEFQESECWVDKTSNDVDCTRHIKRGEMNNIDKEGK